MKLLLVVIILLCNIIVPHQFEKGNFDFVFRALLTMAICAGILLFLYLGEIKKLLTEIKNKQNGTTNNADVPDTN